MTELKTDSRLLKTAVISRFYLWFIRNFKIIENEKARELKLDFNRNVYGDEINYLNCRSIWTDHKGRPYRVRQLVALL